ncbi:transcriptional regulator, TetR family [Frankia torreyi]|uniref:Transcriptional regulator, TetR family n=2 Tax=Frankia TaxID=1854 RepID=A0A0D8BEN9_9ACTN|nr:transcriptional regulator, TetR family [Frankia torreyi]
MPASPAPVAGSAPMPAPGRRATKKAATKRRIQTEALRLFRQQGYDHTTVADIAEAAGVSERTYFRYFATKSEVVLWDYFDSSVVEGLRGQPDGTGLVDAFRAALRESFAQLSPTELADQYRRTELMMIVPELRAAHLDHLVASTADLVALLASRSGASRSGRTGPVADDLELRTLAGAIVGITMSVHLASAESDVVDIPAALDRSLACLNDGFRDL